jgi:predicted metal-dependent hydrolase
MNDPEIKRSKEGIQYKVVYSRRRTIGISISPDKGVIIRAPLRTNLRTIEEVVSSRTGWLRKHQERFSKMQDSTVPLSFTDGSRHQFLGQEYILIKTQAERNLITIEGNNIVVGLKSDESDEWVKKQLYRWYKSEAEACFNLTLNEILLRYSLYNFRPTSVVIRTMRRRWGSCSVRGKITLNTELIKMDQKCIEYVIIHELCHLRHHNHEKEFYFLLSELFPDWEIYRQRLKNHYL